MQADVNDLDERVTDLEEHGGGGGESYDDTELRNRISTIEDKEAGWNAKYNKPVGGIPKSDLASDVQTSLGNIDALKLVNVKNYGAMGNGTTDDTEAIAKAVENVPTGGTLYFPTGTYRVDKIDIKSDMTVRGDGWSSVIKLNDNALSDHNNCLNIRGTSGERIRNVTVCNIKLDGNRVNNASTGASADSRLDGTLIQYADNITFDNVWMYNNGYHGAILTNSSNVSFTNCKSSENGFRPIHGHTGLSNIRIINCYCDNNGLGLDGGSGHLYDAIYVFGVHGCVIEGNTIKGNRTGCIAVSSENTENNDTFGISIVGNACSCYLDENGDYIPSTGDQYGTIGITVSLDNTHNVTVTGNTVLNAYEGIYLRAGSKGAVVSSNSIERCYYGIEVSESSDSLITGNIIRNMGAQAIRMNKCSNISVNGNKILEDSDNPVEALQTTAMHIYATSDCFVSDNYISANNHYKYGFRIYESASISSAHNVIANNRVEDVTIRMLQNESTANNLAYMNINNDVLVLGDLPTWTGGSY